MFLSLPLETAKQMVLWLESEYALETLRGISNADQAAFTLLFESELRKIEAGKPKPARLAAGEQEQAQAEPTGIRRKSCCTAVPSCAACCRTAAR